MPIDKVNYEPALKFYQQHEKHIVSLVVVLLAIYLIAFAAQLTWQLIPAPESSQIDRSNINRDANIGSNGAKTKLDTLLALNLFGDATRAPVIEAQQDVTEAPETRLNLVLSGVVASSDPAVGAAVIEYQNNQNTYGLGDKIEGTQVTLDEIYADRVIIKNRVTRETLMLEGIDFDEANRQRQESQSVQEQTISSNRSLNPPPSANPARNQSSGISRQQVQKLREAQEKIQSQPASLSDFVKLAPAFENGKPVGFKVSPGKDPSIFKQVGLKNGDIVVGLNNYDLSDMEEAREAITLLNDAQSLDFEILRDEGVISLSIDMPGSSND